MNLTNSWLLHLVRIFLWSPASFIYWLPRESVPSFFEFFHFWGPHSWNVDLLLEIILICRISHDLFMFLTILRVLWFIITSKVPFYNMSIKPLHNWKQNVHHFISMTGEEFFWRGTLNLWFSWLRFGKGERKAFCPRVASSSVLEFFFSREMRLPLQFFFPLSYIQISICNNELTEKLYLLGRLFFVITIRPFCDSASCFPPHVIWLHCKLNEINQYILYNLYSTFAYSRARKRGKKKLIKREFLFLWLDMRNGRIFSKLEWKNFFQFILLNWNVFKMHVKITGNAYENHIFIGQCFTNSAEKKNFVLYFLGSMWGRNVWLCLFRSHLECRLIVNTSQMVIYDETIIHLVLMIVVKSIALVIKHGVLCKTKEKSITWD